MYLPKPLIATVIRTLFFCAAAGLITFKDLKERRIPDAYSLGGLAALAALDGALQPASVPAEAAAAAFGFALFWALRLGTRALGFGDVKYAALIGFFVGPRHLCIAMGLAAVSGIAYWAVAVLRLGRSGRERIAFAPFLTIGALAAAALKFAGIGP